MDMPLKYMIFSDIITYMTNGNDIAETAGNRTSLNLKKPIPVFAAYQDDCDTQQGKHTARS